MIKKSRSKVLTVTGVLVLAIAVMAQILWPVGLQAWRLRPYEGLIHNHVDQFMTMIHPTDNTPGASTVSLTDRELLFSDDFDGNALDESRWHTHYWWKDDEDGCTIATNDELEWYQPDEVLVSDGTLKLRAQERTVVNCDGQTYNYTSGMVTTGRELWDHPEPGTFSFQYGYAEARVKVPAGQGLWPAFWLLPCDQTWPPEIDVMEIVGHDTGTAHMALHYLDSDGNYSSRGGKLAGTDFSDGWHTFAVDWRPDAIVWYVDGVESWRYTDSAHIPHEPMYLVLNLAIGGDWAGEPDESTQFPSYFEVDYVNVWSPQ